MIVIVIKADIIYIVPIVWPKEIIALNNFLLISIKELNKEYLEDKKKDKTLNTLIISSIQ